MKGRFILGISMLTTLTLLLGGCEAKYVPDPIDPRLSKYTESGNNVASALINDNLWKSEYGGSFTFGRHEPMVSYFQNSDSLFIQFEGSMDENNQGSTYLSFSLKNTQANSLAGLLNLKGRKFQLGNGENVVTIDVATGCNAPGVGQIYFRSVKYSTSKQIAIISGTFGFDMTAPGCEMTKVTYGRFDVKISSIQNI